MICTHFQGRFYFKELNHAERHWVSIYQRRGVALVASICLVASLGIMFSVTPTYAQSTGNLDNAKAFLIYEASEDLTEQHVCGYRFRGQDYETKQLPYNSCPAWITPR